LKKHLKPSLGKNASSGKSHGVGTRPGIERLFHIFGMLQNAPLNGKKLTCKYLTSELGVDRSTILRDLAFLRDRLGVDVEWDAQEGTYLMIGDYKNLPCMELKETDKLMMAFVEHVLASCSETELGREMLARFHQFCSVFTGKFPAIPEKSAFVFDQMEKSSLLDLKIFHISHRALGARRAVEVQVATESQNATTTLRLEPRAIALSQGRWHLEAIEPSQREFLRLPFSKILEIKLTQIPFAPAKTLKHPSTTAFFCRISHPSPAGDVAWTELPSKAA
jgi:proteasome accessory factor B